MPGNADEVSKKLRSYFADFSTQVGKKRRILDSAGNNATTPVTVQHRIKQFKPWPEEGYAVQVEESLRYVYFLTVGFKPSTSDAASAPDARLFAKFCASVLPLDVVLKAPKITMAPPDFFLVVERAQEYLDEAEMTSEIFDDASPDPQGTCSSATCRTTHP